MLSTTFGLSVNAILWTFRFLVLLLPPVVGWFVYKLCKELAARDGVPTGSRVTMREIPGRLLHGRRADDDESETEPEVPEPEPVSGG